MFSIHSIACCCITPNSGFPVMVTDDVCGVLIFHSSNRAAHSRHGKFELCDHPQLTLSNHFKLLEVTAAHQYCCLFHSHSTEDTSLAAYETCKHKSYDSS